MLYRISEKFKSVQGEGLYTGAPMAFIRFVGCSVGKQICQHCDTDFEETHSWRGGGVFNEWMLLDWAGDHRRICLTGGEPLDQDLEPLVIKANPNIKFHIETSGTKPVPAWLGGRAFVCVSPKPGFKDAYVMEADEIKVTVPGLGSISPSVKNLLVSRYDVPGDRTLGWPTLEDALRWAAAGKTVFLQPRNARHDIDQNNLRIVLEALRDYPQLRLSAQLHKMLKVQ